MYIICRFNSYILVSRFNIFSLLEVYFFEVMGMLVIDKFISKIKDHSNCLEWSFLVGVYP